MIFEDLCTFLGSKHSPTTAYRPQGNAQNERAHKELHAYIAMYLNPSSSSSWDLLLAHAAWVHNSTYHTALKKSPFEVLTGLIPRNAKGIFAAYESDCEQTLEEYYEMRSKELEELLKFARLAIAQAQATSLERENQHKRFQKWEVEQKIYVRTHPLRLIGKKWSDKFTGPYVISEVISPQVLRIKNLPGQAKFEDVIHSSYARPMKTRVEKETPLPANDPPPAIEEEDEEEIESNDAITSPVSTRSLNYPPSPRRNLRSIIDNETTQLSTPDMSGLSRLFSSPSPVADYSSPAHVPSRSQSSRSSPSSPQYDTPPTTTQDSRSTTPSTNRSQSSTTTTTSEGSDKSEIVSPVRSKNYIDRRKREESKRNLFSDASPTKPVAKGKPPPVKLLGSTIPDSTDRPRRTAFQSAKAAISKLYGGQS
jgi:hypothetical protein